MLMAVTAYTDAQLLRDFRDLFRLTPEEAAATGISAEMWLAIENGTKGEADRPGLEAKLKQLRALMDVVGAMPYSTARTWALTPLPDYQGKSPRDLILSGIFGVGALLTHLGSQTEQIAL